MEGRNILQRGLWVVMMLIGMMLAACQPASAPSSTGAPAAEEGAAASSQGELPCPEGTEPRNVDFGQPVEQESDELQGLVIVSSGTYINELDQPFIITVIGRATEPVVAYTAALEVCLLAAQPGRQPPEGDDAKVIAQNPEMKAEDVVLATRALLDENVENLIIDIELALNVDELREQFPDGYDLLETIHPNINNGVSHNYRKKWRQSATVTTVITAGSVRSRLWANCANSVVLETPGSLTLFGNPGFDWFDFAVTGLDNLNDYKLKGAWATGADTYTVALNPTCGS